MLLFGVQNVGDGDGQENMHPFFNKENVKEVEIRYLIEGSGIFYPRF
jgi:cupin superfamily acireductone dioxygenase involved in methionine salvage